MQDAMYMYVRMCIGNGSPTRVSVLLTLAHLQAAFSIWGEGGGGGNVLRTWLLCSLSL